MFLAMFDMPDVAKVFCPAAPHISDDPQAIILQAQLRRLKAEKDAEAEAAAEATEPAGRGRGGSGCSPTRRSATRGRSDTLGEGQRSSRRSRSR